MSYSQVINSIVLVCCVFMALKSHAQDKLVLLTENYPPFNMSVEDKNFARGNGIDGVSTDLVREMVERSGIPYSLTLRSPWSRIFDMAQKRPNYGLFSTTFTEERKPLFKWVGPLVANDWVIFKKAGSTIEITSLGDLKRYKVGGYKGDATSEFLKEKGINVIEAVTDKRNAEKLSGGHIDLWASSRYSAPYIADVAGVDEPVAAYTFRSVELYLALNKGTPDSVVSKLQDSLDGMKDDGTVAEIMDRYL
ncbi:ABC transporter substrate-binding protein [Parendozoicomonas sp. Alg238-R29]|uniref:substrate-binding periplasmic protein n=1 Tax=Parendozoicomonas sp. Alg238-R29 TaxID=2993446 RepID=UPI00248DC830|nr:ABC transporter substrate-binding protein [Parendozoicomonas sp. Alg238-R29]